MNRLLAYDGTNIIHRAYFAQRLGAHDGPTDPARTVAIALGMVARWTRSVDPRATVALAMDGGDSGRKARFPEYKATRAQKPADLVETLRLFFQVAQGSYAVRRIPGYEADDVLATLAAQQRAAGGLTVVLSSDKDILQLAEVGTDAEGQSVDIVEPWLIRSARKIEQWPARHFAAVQGFPPDRLPLYNALAGEPTENWPGVPGVGPTWARQLCAIYASADEMIADTTPRIFPKVHLRATLQKHADLIRLGVWLATLQRDVPGVTLP